MSVLIRCRPPFCTQLPVIRSAWTRLKFLYIFLRYFSLIAQVYVNDPCFHANLALLNSCSVLVNYDRIATILTLGLAAPLYPGRSVCLLLLSFQAISSQALMMGVQVLLVLRGTCFSTSPKIYPHLLFAVIALYNRVHWLRTFLSVLFLAEVVLMTVFFGISLSSMDYGVHCVITGFPITATGFLCVFVSLRTCRVLLMQFPNLFPANSTACVRFERTLTFSQNPPYSV